MNPLFNTLAACMPMLVKSLKAMPEKFKKWKDGLLATEIFTAQFGTTFEPWKAEMEKLLKDIPLHDILNLAWNYRESVEKCFGMQELLKVIRDNYNLSPASGISGVFVFKKTSLSSANTIELHIASRSSQSGDPILDGMQPYCVVYTQELKNDLCKQFADKPLLVIQ